MMLIAWTMRKSRYDEAEGGENKRQRLVNTFSATKSIKLQIFWCSVYNVSRLLSGHGVLAITRLLLSVASANRATCAFGTTLQPRPLASGW